MRTAIYLLGLLVLAFVGMQLVSKKEGETEITDPTTNTYLQTQPQQMFPMQSIETPRVDNADQPWYGGSREFMGITEEAYSGLSFGFDNDFMGYNTNQMWTDLSKQYMN